MFVSLNHYRRSRASQKRHVLWLSLALTLWLVALAGHVHAGDEHVGSNDLAHACSVCSVAPTAAAPPAASPSLAPLLGAEHNTGRFLFGLITNDVPSSYLVRGPPAI